MESSCLLTCLLMSLLHHALPLSEQDSRIYDVSDLQDEQSSNRRDYKHPLYGPMRGSVRERFGTGPGYAVTSNKRSMGPGGGVRERFGDERLKGPRFGRFGKDAPRYGRFGDAPKYGRFGKDAPRYGRFGDAPRYGRFGRELLDAPKYGRYDKRFGDEEMSDELAPRYGRFGDETAPRYGRFGKDELTNDISNLNGPRFGRFGKDSSNLVEDMNAPRYGRFGKDAERPRFGRFGDSEQQDSLEAPRYGRFGKDAGRYKRRPGYGRFGKDSVTNSVSETLDDTIQALKDGLLLADVLVDADSKSKTNNENEVQWGRFGKDEKQS